jgi:hypothetical protein
MWIDRVRVILKGKGMGLYSGITERIQPTFTFTPRPLDISRPLTVGAVG